MAETVDERGIGREISQACADRGSSYYLVSGYLTGQRVAVRVLFDTRKYMALRALDRRSLSLLARSSRRSSRDEPFVDRSEMMRKALHR